MEQLAVHSLIKLNDWTLLRADQPIPHWAIEMLQLSPYVIVRRGEQTQEIPVGIRGFAKNQRFAAMIATTNIAQIVTPEEALSLQTKLAPNRLQLVPFQTLRQLQSLLETFTWGVGGSLEYELVTGIPMVRLDSDIDVIMSLPTTKITIATAQKLLKQLRLVTSVHVDIQIIKGEYGFSLEEYANQRSKEILVKTNHGPILVADPWQLLTEVDQ